MSLLIYNGISLYLMKTLEFLVEPEYDQSHTDVMWYTHTIRAQGILSNTGSGIALPSAPNIATVKHMLATPRQSLTYQMNDGTPILNTVGVDVAMGPEPLHAPVVRQVTSDAIFCEVGYKVRIRDCDTGNPDPVVSLRWEQSESFDENWLSRLTTRGRLVVRSDLGQSADSFRAQCTPLVSADYVRTSADYVQSPNGCELGFTFVDQERYYLPPRPATKASGRCTVSVQKGGIRMGQCDVHLEGPKGINRADLMAVAIRMCWAKLQAEGLQAALAEGKFSESLFENVVDVSLSGRLSVLNSPVAAAGGAAGVAVAANPPAIMKSVGVTPGISEGAAGLAPPIRRRIIGLLVALFRDPCAADEINSTDTDLRTTPGGTSPLLNTTLSGPPVPSTGAFSLSTGVLPTTPTGLAIKDLAPYEHYIVQSEYHFDTGQRQMPGTGVGSQGGVSSVITVHGGAMQLVVNWTASRSGIPPVLPAWSSADPNLVMIDKPIIMPDNQDIGPDGSSPTYTVSGVYKYAVMDPSKVSILAPTPPFLTTSADQSALLAAGYYDPGILFQFQGSSGSNPFFGRTQSGQPNASVALGLGLGAVVGGAVQIAQANAVPPSVAGGLGSSSNSGGLLPQPRVNP